MQHIDLAGNWQLRRGEAPPIEGYLPGCNYLDYIANGMPDPFWGENETIAKELAHHDYAYSRSFDLPESFLTATHVELVAQGLDTLCTLLINGSILGKTNNIHRTWRLDAKPFLNPGKNTIEIRIDNPYVYMATQQEKEPLSGQEGNKFGATYLRKPPCDFGWDWGPELPPAGLVGNIGLESFEIRIEDLRIRQHHTNGQVALAVNMELSHTIGLPITGVIMIHTPDGKQIEKRIKPNGCQLDCQLQIENPQLWWCNGLGKQPLYQLEVTVLLSDEPVDTWKRQVGLRTIELDTAADDYGGQFRFVVNGVPVFAKGANWIRADTFSTRVTRDDIDFYIESAKRANMNMLRVWGGGLYENEYFYDACDKNGILVWQDFVFACGVYPLHDQSFLDNVYAEVVDNVRRIRHRACLALWCGNNENEYSAIGKANKGSEAERAGLPFYHNTLRNWVNELDGITPYWPGSPSAGGPEYRLHKQRMGSIRGDNHLWHIWHGLMPIEAFRKLPTRFCSEFGVESLPAMQTIRTFTDEPNPSLFDPVMQLHQKSPGGNEKMLYYLLAKYRNPAMFEDFVYLSQLVQANAIRFATDCWRRRIGLTNGALFWQLNDCWPVASWSSIDYNKQLKAVMYQARHFNKMLCLSNDYFDNRAELYVSNEYPKRFKGTLIWRLNDFNGVEINAGEIAVSVPAVSAERAITLQYAEILNGQSKTDVALTVILMREEQILDEKHWLLVPDRDARLPCTSLQAEYIQDGNQASVILHSTAYARYVYLDAEGVTAPWSDNFFDIPAGQNKRVTVLLPEEIDIGQLQKNIKIKTLADVKPQNGKLKDKWIRLTMALKKKNYMYWFIFKMIS